MEKTWCVNCDAEIQWDEGLGWGAIDGWECVSVLGHISSPGDVLRQLVAVYHELRS